MKFLDNVVALFFNNANGSRDYWNNASIVLSAVVLIIFAILLLIVGLLGPVGLLILILSNGFDDILKEAFEFILITVADLFFLARFLINRFLRRRRARLQQPQEKKTSILKAYPAAALLLWLYRLLF